MRNLSVIIPCYNESIVVREIYHTITEVFKDRLIEEHYNYELIFVNDGSCDDTLDIIKDIALNDSLVKYISFSRNFGKEAAMIAGLKHAVGDIVIIIDSDLQHPPHLMLDMIKEYENGYDQVIAKRSRTGENFTRKWITKFYYRIINLFIDVELVDGMGDFRLLSRKAVNAIISMPENNRFSKGLFSWIGFKKKVIEYENQERQYGESKWSFGSLLNYALDGMISFNNKPLRIFIYLGLIITFMNSLYIGFSFINILLFGIDMPGYFTIISSILILGGIQLIAIGVIGEYVGRIFYEVKQRPYYIVEETNLFNDKKATENTSRFEMSR